MLKANILFEQAKWSNGVPQKVTVAGTISGDIVNFVKDSANNISIDDHQKAYIGGSTQEEQV